MKYFTFPLLLSFQLFTCGAPVSQSNESLRETIDGMAFTEAMYQIKESGAKPGDTLLVAKRKYWDGETLAFATQENETVVWNTYYRKNGDLFYRESFPKISPPMSTFYETFLDEGGDIKNAVSTTLEGEETYVIDLSYRYEYHENGEVKRLTIKSNDLEDTSSGYSVAEYDDEGRMINELTVTNADTMNYTTVVCEDSISVTTRRDFLHKRITVERRNLRTQDYEEMYYTMGADRQKSTPQKVGQISYYDELRPRMKYDSSFLSGEVERSYFIYVPE